MSAVSRHHRVPPADAAAITATLKAVFVHPEPRQCTRSMTAQFVSQFFSADAARSGTSVLRTCRDRQRERAQLAKRYRLVTIHDLEVGGHRAHAIVRGANGYPIGVSLVAGPGGWRLDASGTAIQASGHGQQVAPQGSLYAYRIPHGFIAAGTRVGPVTTSGAAFSTGVALPGGPSGDGVAVAQTAANSHIQDLAALRTILPRVDRAVRGAPIARVIGPPVVHDVGGRPAVTWTLADIRSATAPTDGKATFVFSLAANVVVVNCRWPHAGPQQAALRAGCDAVLATLAVG
ncbi:MAG: hypothetical protein ACXVH3_05525 [Solirubrobacteraceae bacterium]